MKKSLLVTALALVLALGTLIGLAVRLEGTVTPLGTKAVQSWGDPAAAGDLTVHTAAVFGERLFWNTDYHVAEEQENTRFTFRPQGQVQQLGALITDVKDEWYLTRLCLTESGDYVTADLLDESGQDQTRKVRAKDVFAAYGFYLT